MKNITKTLFAFIAILAISCDVDDVENRPVIQGENAPVLLTPDEGSNYNLLIENASLQAERFVWTDADFGGDVVVDYVVEMDNAGDEFASPVILGAISGATNLAVSTENLNAKAVELGGEPEVSAEYEIRIKSSVGSVDPMYSNVITMSITPYQAFVPMKHLYVVGTATEFGFNNNNGNTPLFRDNGNQYKFYLRSYFNAGELKLLETLGAWQPQYGTNDGTALAVSTAGGDPGAITVANAGYYDLVVDLENMTYTLTEYNATGATTYATIGITGSATPEGWPDNGIQDVDMTTTTLNPHIWHVSDITLSAQEAKFRADNDWATNWGGSTAVTGVAVINAGNIPVAQAGTYDVWFNDLDGRYIFIMQ